MADSSHTPTLLETLLAPVRTATAACAAHRHCPSLPDENWIELGLARVLHASASGRACLQGFAGRIAVCPHRGHYFEALKSARRLQLGTQLNTAVAGWLTPEDPFASLPALADFDVYAADGHWHGAATHDEKSEERAWAVGHLYALNLRTQALVHLTACEGRKEHDMHALKRLGPEALRLGAPAGRKVVQVYDRAGIDFAFWFKAKRQHGLYFISRTKENMALEVVGIQHYAADEPLNRGVTADELVATSQHVAVRRVSYCDPLSGRRFEFITTEFTLPPGLIAYLYLRRWDVEKVFDELKNKLGQTQAWASSLNAKAMQAQFLCLAHNLLVWFQARLAREHDLRNTAEEQRRARRFAAQTARALASGTPLMPLIAGLQRLSQCSLKLLRWIQAHFFSPLPYINLLPVLRCLYATL